MLINITKDQWIKLFTVLFTVWMILSGVLLIRPGSIHALVKNVTVSNCAHSKVAQQVSKICQESGSHLAGILTQENQLLLSIATVMMFLWVASLYRMLRLHIIYKPPRLHLLIA